MDVKQGTEGESLGKVEKDLGLRMRGSTRGKYVECQCVMLQAAVGDVV